MLLTTESSFQEIRFVSLESHFIHPDNLIGAFFFSLMHVSLYVCIQMHTACIGPQKGHSRTSDYLGWSCGLSRASDPNLKVTPVFPALCLGCVCCHSELYCCSLYLLLLVVSLLHPTWDPWLVFLPSLNLNGYIPRFFSHLSFWVKTDLTSCTEYFWDLNMYTQPAEYICSFWTAQAF